MQALAISTSSFPFRLIAYLDQHNRNFDRVKEAVQAQIGVYKYAFHTRARLMIAVIYKRHRKRHDPVYNSILYQAMCEFAEIIIDKKISYLNSSNLKTVFFTSKYFVNSNEELYFKETYPDSNPQVTQPPIEQPVLLGTLESTQYYIGSSLAEVLTLFERAGIIELSMVPNRSNMYKLGLVKGSKIKYVDDESIDKVFDLTPEEKGLVEIVKKYDDPYVSISEGDNIYTAVESLHPFTGPDWIMDSKVDIYNVYNTKVAWENVRDRLENAERHLLEAFSDKLNILHDNTISEYRIEADSISFKQNGKKCQILFEFVGDQIEKDHKYDKSIILRDPKVNKIKIQSNKVKYFVFSKWDEFDEKLEKIRDYVNQL